MVSSHPESIPYQILPEFGQCMHDGQHLLIIYGIQPLMRKELPALQSYRVSPLHQYYADPLSRRITLQDKWLRKIRQRKHWAAAHHLLEPIKGSLRCI